MDEAPTARVVPGDPWHVEVTYPDRAMETAVVYDGAGSADGVVRAYRDPAVPPPNHHVQAAVECLGYDVDEYSRLSQAIRDGSELPLRPVRPHEADRRLREEPQRIAAAFSREGAGRVDVAVSLPTAEVADYLRDIRDATPYCLEPAGVELLTGLTRLIDDGVTSVLVPADLVYELTNELRKSPLRGIRDESHGRMELLAELIAEGRPHRGSWPAVLEALGHALQEALARPGEEGVAARDELLDLVRHFADVHRHTTHPDDADQQQLQAERMSGLDDPGSGVR